MKGNNMKLENVRNARRRHMAGVKAANLREYNKALYEATMVTALAMAENDVLEALNDSNTLFPGSCATSVERAERKALRAALCVLQENGLSEVVAA